MSYEKEPAKELLLLERKYQHEELNEQESQRWNSLLPVVLQQDNPHGRRSLRIPTDVKGQVRIGAGTFPCTVTDTSLLGLKLSGPVFRYLDANYSVELLAVESEGKRHELHLSCSPVRFASDGEQTEVAVTIDKDNSLAAQRHFFEDLYYPNYLHYIEKLAGETPPN